MFQGLAEVEMCIRDRNSGDRAKLISSNDSANFTFRGERFSDAGQALRIGYETTQKAHSALR